MNEKQYPYSVSYCGNNTYYESIQEIMKLDYYDEINSIMFYGIYGDNYDILYLPGLSQDQTILELPINLKILSIDYTKIETLPKLPEDLLELYCEDNNLKEINTIPKKLKILHIFENKITKLPELPDTLIELDCSDNPISIIPTLPLNLTILNISDININSIPKLPDTLTDFDCSYNNLSILPKLPDRLITFDCSYNNLSILPKLPNTLLNLYCSDNKLHFLPKLSDKFKELECSNNKLNSLPKLSKFIKFIICENNELTDLNEINNTESLINKQFNINDNYLRTIKWIPLIKKILNEEHNMAFYWFRNQYNKIPISNNKYEIIIDDTHGSEETEHIGDDGNHYIYITSKPNTFLDDIKTNKVDDKLKKYEKMNKIINFSENYYLNGLYDLSLKISNLKINFEYDELFSNSTY